MQPQHPPGMVPLTGVGFVKGHVEALGRTDQYQVVLPLLKARTPDIRAARLAAAVAGLAEEPTSP